MRDDGVMLRRRWVFLLLVSLVVASCGGQRRLNVVLVSFDTTRADRLGAYGYERETSPNFDALAEESFLFERAYSQAVLTSPSHGSMLTGLRPHSHGSLSNGDRMRAGVPTLAERLGEEGYESAAFVSSVVLAPKSSDVSRGFDTFDANFPALRRSAWATTSLAKRWIASLDPSAPYFLFVHYYDTHGPFWAKEDLIAEFRRDVPARPVTVPRYQIRDGQNDIEFYSDVYDAAIRQQDAFFGWLLRSVDLDRTIVVVIADHGESFDERHMKIDHGTYVYEEQTRIPMLVHVPGRKARRVEAMVETTDLFPSLLEWLGIPSVHAFDGVSFVEPAEAGGSGTRARAVSIALAQKEAFEDRGYKLDPRYPVVSILTEAAPFWKLIRYPGVDGPIYELFRLETDPMETVDLAVEEAAVRDELVENLLEEVPSLEEQQREVLNPGIRRQLESLGYVE